MASTSVAPAALPIPIPPAAALTYTGTSCPTGIALKSTNTSARSPGPNATDGRATGTASSPASLATCSIGSELPSLSTSVRALQPLSSLNRTHCLGACHTGANAPFTRRVSPV